MLWQETSPVEERARFIDDHQLGLSTMIELCARYAIRRKAGYKWLERDDGGGRPALQDRLEESAWGQGFVRGVLDADFLSPLPARSGFEENEDWIAVLDLLDRYLPTLDAELEGHLAAHRARQASEIGDRALRLARDILDLDEFRDLALPGGLAKRGRPEHKTTRGYGTGRQASRRRSGGLPAAPGTDPSSRGRRIRYEEIPFEDGSRAHSRFVSGVV